ncbi:MAG: ribonuclease PH, partial [Henriciella sp.]
MRPSGRAADQLRDIVLETNVTRYAEGSCLAKFGHTHVLCTASWQDNVPPWLRGQGKGWVTGEYGMLPRATHTRGRREATAGKQSGRTQEIQRLIGRSLRSVVDLTALGENQLTIDCDVIQADGGTRTASITGGFVAMALAIKYLREEGVIDKDPIQKQAAAIS